MIVLLFALLSKHVIIIIIGTPIVRDRQVVNVHGVPFLFPLRSCDLSLCMPFLTEVLVSQIMTSDDSYHLEGKAEGNRVSIYLCKVSFIYFTQSNVM